MTFDSTVLQHFFVKSFLINKLRKLPTACPTVLGGLLAVAVSSAVLPARGQEIPSLPVDALRYDQPLTPPTVVAPALGQPPDWQPDFDAYHLGPDDSIFVSVPRYPDLNFQAVLDLNGNIIVPLQGSVSFEKLTIAQAEERLRSIYNQYVEIRDDQDVTVTLVGRRSVQVTIIGAVQRPGFYPLADPSVSSALLIAGGARRDSDLRGIQVQRNFYHQGQLVESSQNVDLFTPLREGAPLPNVRLEDGDVLVVPELDPSQLSGYDSFLVARSTLAQPVINVRFLNYAGGRGGVGTLDLNSGSSFVDAVSVLGVNPDNANLGKVALIRFDPESGRAVTVTLDAKSAILGDITQNPPLQDNDVIVVGRNLVGRISYALGTIARPFRDILGFTNFFDSFINGNSLFD
jgi:polysaccharide export outer membrane protein